MQISKFKKEITDELTTMESHFGDMDIKELSLVDRSDRLDKGAAASPHPLGCG